MTTNPVEKKQIVAVNQSYAHLLEKTAANDIASDVMKKLENLVAELTNRNYSGATAIQTVSLFEITYISI